MPHGYSIYAGEPATDKDVAWSLLTERRLEYPRPWRRSSLWISLITVVIEASSEELARTGEDPKISAKLIKGGYMASLAAYHDLHCIVSPSISIPL